MRSPGVVWPRFVRRRLDGQGMVKLLAIDNFGLVGLLVEDGISQGLVFVEDSNFSFGILANSDLGITQGVIRAVGLDLVDDFLELEGQVFGEGARFLPDQDVRQIFQRRQGAMGVMLAAWRNRKTLVEVGDELRQISIA